MSTATLEPTTRGGRVVGRYRLERRLGAGSSGVVWLAWDELLGRPVALKRVDHANPMGRAIQEARAASAIAHPGIVLIYDVVSNNVAGVDWVVMEALSGRSLADVVLDGERLGVPEAGYVGRAVLAALEAIHADGLLHRDVKPSNIQLCEDGRVVLVDFGLAGRPAPADAALIVGSLPYLAPELLTGGSYSPASDLYALGMTLYAALTGRVPRTPALTGVGGQGFDRGGAELPMAMAPFDVVVAGLLEPDPRARLTARQTRRLLTATQHGAFRRKSVA